MARVDVLESRPGDWPDRVVQPWGAVEWHGGHLPLGLDSLVASWFAGQLADRLGAALMPCQHNPMTTLPHPCSLQISSELYRMLVRETIRGLAGAGFRTIVVVSGHYAQGHMVELYRAARELGADLPVRIFVGSPLEPLGDPDLLDHAGRSEAAQLLAIRPDLVNLSELPETMPAKDHAVLGPHPGAATAEEGRELLDRALAAWAAWIESEPSVEALDTHYQDAEGQYADYVSRFYRVSWEQAIADWWQARTT